MLLARSLFCRRTLEASWQPSRHRRPLTGLRWQMHFRFCANLTRVRIAEGLDSACSRPPPFPVRSDFMHFSMKCRLPVPPPIMNRHCAGPCADSSSKGCRYRSVARLLARRVGSCRSSGLHALQRGKSTLTTVVASTSLSKGRLRRADRAVSPSTPPQQASRPAPGDQRRLCQPYPPLDPWLPEEQPVPALLTYLRCSPQPLVIVDFTADTARLLLDDANSSEAFCGVALPLAHARLPTSIASALGHGRLVALRKPAVLCRVVVRTLENLHV